MQLRYLVITAKLAVGAGLIYLLVRNAGLREVWAVLKTAQPVYAAASVACFVLVVVVNALRWRAVFDVLGTQLPRSVAVWGTFEGMFFNLFLPTGVGGDVVRAYRAYDHGLTARRAAECGLIDRAFGLWGLAAAVAVAAAFSTALTLVPGWQILAAGAVVVVAGGLAVAWGTKFIPDSRRGWAGRITEFLRTYAGVVHARRFWTAIVPLLAVANLLIGASAWMAAMSLGLDASLADMTIVIEGGALTAMVPISIGGWGVREGTSAFLLNAMGHPLPAAIAASALMGLVLAVIGLIGALVWMLLPYRRLPGRSADVDSRPPP
ncbi:lysylphosphatidylglycerol synthase transmembrane domain-containing protein [Mesorhizobium sp. Z1-4]|uniref:lysylphosphatidylglycerol synthase transmembrane domain-containing protein n=1 Tax=Mesorhizobium sp. Z1-4 TaxID=2448478 RepID=UPI0013DEBF6E|nr:lysylphosphatidylglycerol synthase transmembrane domain-containing protein [Mesorhizobium sp. Z1-4]